MNADARNETIGLSEEECDVLRDWWDEDETAGVESSFPIIDRIIAAAVEQERAAWAAKVGVLAGKWSGCWCGEQMAPDHDPRVQDCPQHGDGAADHFGGAIRDDLRALLPSDSTAALDAVKAEAGRAAWVEGYCRSSDDFEHHINACANRECDCPSNPLAANPYGHDQGGTQ